MLVTFGGIVIKIKPLAFINIPLGILVNLEPGANITEVNFDAVPNAPDPMVVTLDGMVMEVKLVAMNAPFPMLVTPSGMLTDVKLVACWNTPVPMLVTPDGMTMDDKAVELKNTPFPRVVNLEPASNIIEVNAGI